MGWSFNWLWSLRTDFNYDFEVSIPHDVEHAGLSAFVLEDGLLRYSRGLEAFQQRLPVARPRSAGRDEDELPLPFAWIRRHDEYEDPVAAIG